MLTSILLGILLLPNAGKDDRDVIELISGKTVKGRVVLELEDVIFVRIGTSERKIKRSKIKEFSSVFRAQWKVLEKLKKPGRGTTKSLLALADNCRQNKLPHTERLFCWRALLIDPSNDEVNVRLGHKKRKGKWRIPGRGGALSFDRAVKVRSDWGKAWELRSEHYRVRSSSGLRMVIDTLFDLEYFYHYSLRLWQDVLELREVLEPMMINVYKDDHEYPSLSSTAGAYFQPAANTVYLVGGELGVRPYALFHEATHSLHHNTVSGTSRTRGALPAWLNEGWAEYMRGVISAGRSGSPSFRPGARIREHMQTIAGAKRVYDLHRVLNFKSSDYGASSRQNVKYAQGYVLFHYLMHGSTDAMLENFLEYLQSAVAGKGQASTFRRIFRKDLKKIERAQQAYARG